jgi:hypothetical protein
MGWCGNKGFYFRAPLELLQKHLQVYLAAANGNKTNFWTNFWPTWDATYPALESDELHKELKDLEREFITETECIKHRNTADIKRKSYCTAKLEKLPAPSAQLDELCAWGSIHDVHDVFSILFHHYFFFIENKTRVLLWKTKK